MCSITFSLLNNVSCYQLNSPTNDVLIIFSLETIFNNEFNLFQFQNNDSVACFIQQRYNNDFVMMMEWDE